MNNLSKISDDELNAKYESGERRVLNQIDRIKLPELVEALKKPEYVNLPPLHQRRVLWDCVQQSRLIESFIANIPVPPMVFYEKEHKSYEVIDGRQRISTIEAFYENQLRLSGLELWPELNGCTYTELPWKVRTALDRRSISCIVIIAPIESTSSEAMQLKQLAFERLNLGRLNP